MTFLDSPRARRFDNVEEVGEPFKNGKTGHGQLDESITSWGEFKIDTQANCCTWIDAEAGTCGDRIWFALWLHGG